MFKVVYVMVTSVACPSHLMQHEHSNYTSRVQMRLMRRAWRLLYVLQD